MTNIVGKDTVVAGDLPSDAANYSSLNAYASKTQSDWESGIRGPEDERWGQRVLGGLFGGLEQGKPFVLSLLQSFIRTIFDDPVGTYGDADSAFAAIAASFSGKWRDLLNVKDASLYTAAQVAASARPIVDLFDGGALDALSKWDINYVQPLAGGRIKLDGFGNCWWNSFGFADRTGRARYTPAVTATDVQIITIVMPLKTQDPTPSGQPAHMRIIGRANTAMTSYVYAEITDSTMELGCVVGGSETVFATSALTPADSDVWDFLVGTSGNNYYLNLKRNGVSVLTYDDVLNTSAKGPSYRSVGFEMYASSRGLHGQTSPGTMAVFSADDN